VIAIVDYGLGNLASVRNAFAAVGETPNVTSDPVEIRDASGIVLPGVGAASAGMRRLQERGLDTVIGEGTKIDNQVQIGHNVTIGRHCLLAAQIGLAGSLTIGDNVALGAKVGINNHLKIGDGAQVTAMSAVKDDIPANGRWGGHFAKPTKQWFREIIAVERLVRDNEAKGKEQECEDHDKTCCHVAVFRKTRRWSRARSKRYF